MKIELRYSQNSLLQKYIHCYYGADIGVEKYIAFPNYYVPACIINKAIFKSSNNVITIKKDSTKNLAFYCVNTYKKPLNIKSDANLETFNIVFKSYGLAQFISASVDFKNQTVLDCTKIFEPFFNNHPLFHTYSLNKKITTIENYLLSILSVKDHTDLVIKKIDHWLTDKSEYKKSTKTDKTLYRAFKNICGESPGTLYKSIRLRKAMQAIIEQPNNDQKLTDIAYNLDFFDQAHFSKFFKKSTEKLPKNFTNNLTLLPIEYEEENIFFEFIHNVH